MAIEKAKQTLVKEGYNLNDWQLTRAYNPESSAPNGKQDRYFDRFSFQPTAGRVHFTDGHHFRTVQVQLEEKRVICFMFYGL